MLTRSCLSRTHRKMWKVYAFLDSSTAAAESEAYKSIHHTSRQVSLLKNAPGPIPNPRWLVLLAQGRHPCLPPYLDPRQGQKEERRGGGI